MHNSLATPVMSQLAQVLFLAARAEEERSAGVQNPNPHAYFRPIHSDDQMAAPSMPLALGRITPKDEQDVASLPLPPFMGDSRILATPSPLIPPPSPLYMMDQERVVLEELNAYLRRAASPFGFGAFLQSGGTRAPSPQPQFPPLNGSQYPPSHSAFQRPSS